MKLISNAVWEVLLTELDSKRAELHLAHERIDRLTEAIARKSGVDLILPQSQPPVLEPSPGWFDLKKNPQVIVNLKGETT